MYNFPPHLIFSHFTLEFVTAAEIKTFLHITATTVTVNILGYDGSRKGLFIHAATYLHLSGYSRTPTNSHGLKQSTWLRTNHSGGCWWLVALRTHRGACRRWWPLKWTKRQLLCAVLLEQNFYRAGNPLPSIHESNSIKHC